MKFQVQVILASFVFLALSISNGLPKFINQTCPLLNIKNFGPFKMDVQEQFHKIQGEKLNKIQCCIWG